VGNLSTVELHESDDAASVLERLAWVDPGRAALVVPWRLSFLSRPLDYQLLRREADRRQLEIAIISEDPERRVLARHCGFPNFVDVGDAQNAQVWRSHRHHPEEPPPVHWWSQPIDLKPRTVRPRAWWMHWTGVIARISAFLMVVAVLTGTAYAIIPSASVTLVPEGREFVATVPVSLDPDAESVNLAMGLIPARKVGLEIEGHIEVRTTGVAEVAAGKAVGEVLFTNLLVEQYIVPAGTVVRTSSTSYPVRFRTMADVALAAGGQATVPIEGLQPGVGNVGAFYINQVEGVAASAVRVTNVTPTSGAETQEVHVVSREDQERARRQLTQQLLDQAYEDMQGLLHPTEVLLGESLTVEAVPKLVYSSVVAEQADSVGLDLRVLVDGLALDVDDAKSVAYSRLVRQVPQGYMLVDASFELGEVAEEDIGIGAYTIFVTAHGYASQQIDLKEAVDLMRGKKIPEVRKQLSDNLPLATEAQINVWPKCVRRMPLIQMRIHVSIVPQAGAAARAHTGG